MLKLYGQIEQCELAADVVNFCNDVFSPLKDFVPVMFARFPKEFRERVLGTFYLPRNEMNINFDAFPLTTQQNKDLFVEVITHEFVHVLQWTNGVLSSSGLTNIYWRGELVKVNNPRCEWEVEARRVGTNLKRLFHLSRLVGMYPESIRRAKLEIVGVSKM